MDDEIIKYRKEYYIKNRERIKTYAKEYYQLNKKKILSKQRIYFHNWYLNHKMHYKQIPKIDNLPVKKIVDRIIVSF